MCAFDFVKCHDFLTCVVFNFILSFKSSKVEFEMGWIRQQNPIWACEAQLWLFFFDGKRKNQSKSHLFVISESK